MTETRLSVYSRCRQYQSSVVKLLLKVLNSSAEQQLCDCEFQTEGELTLKVLANNESVILDTDSNSLSADHSGHSGW